MNPDKYIFAPEATSEATLEKLIRLLVADDLDEDALTNPALTSREHELHTLAVMFYVTGVELGRIPNGFDHSDETYIEVRKGVDLLGPQDPMSILFRIYDEDANSSKPTLKARAWKDEELDELDTENLQEGIYTLINSFLDYVTEAAKLDEDDLKAFRVAASEFAEIEATKSGIIEESNADGVLALDGYKGDITIVIFNIMDEFKKNGIHPAAIYKTTEEFRSAGGRYANYLVPIIEFEIAHNNDVAKMRDAATDDLNLMEHVLGGIQKFTDLDPLGIALQLFKKAVLDPNI